MWPMFVDYSEEDCKKVLRSLELEAYASIINAFRAQGCLTKDRRKILQDLCSSLSISMERHRAEVRRAVNDEHLNTIAEKLFGPNTATEWAIEGRRVVPLMQRLAPQTVFTEIANSVASAQAAKNAAMLHPGKTGLREVSNGIETMACRKRKDFMPDYASMSPYKIAAMDNQPFNSMCYAESTHSTISEPSQVPEMPLSSDNFSVPEAVPQISLPDFNAPRNTMPLTTSAPISLPSKSTPKHPMLKSSSTVTTFSSFDQMTSNLVASRSASQNPASTFGHGDQVSTVNESIKSSSDLKSAPRSLTSLGSMKSSTIVIPTSVSSTCSTSANKPNLPTPSSSSQNNKFLTQIRSKNPSHTRQNMPAGLGIKLSSQTQVAQRATLSPKSLSMKMKSENTNLVKKSIPNAFPPVTDNQTTQFQLPVSTDSVTVTKSPVSVAKTNAKPESQTILQHQPSTKQTAVTKTIAKTTTAPSSSQYNISRSLFSTANKGGAKNLSPVIFNVSSTSCSPMQTTKTTGPIQSEAGKTNPQLLPKSAAVGISQSHLKINTSNTQTIQYRNDGGLVRSARIVNISQPVGSRLPCAISSSAISALGLTTNLSSTALRVTLPAGTLNTTSSIRVSAAAKPNVIVVHKAQMWPRPQPGGAVIMGSSPLNKLSNDIESGSPFQKQDKNRPLMSKPQPRSIAPARPQSPAVSVSIKVSEANPVANPASNASPSAVMNATSNPVSSSITNTTQSDGSTNESQNSKVSENMSEASKKNLLPDIIEITEVPSDKNTSEKTKSKDKNDFANSKELCNNQEVESKLSQKSVVSFRSEINVKPLESNTSKTEATSVATGDVALLPVSEGERNGVDGPKSETPQAQIAEAQTKEATATVSTTHTSSESGTSSSECGSKVQTEVVKEKDL